MKNDYIIQYGYHLSHLSPLPDVPDSSRSALEATWYGSSTKYLLASSYLEKLRYPAVESAFPHVVNERKDYTSRRSQDSVRVHHRSETYFTEIFGWGSWTPGGELKVSVCTSSILKNLKYSDSEDRISQDTTLVNSLSCTWTALLLGPNKGKFLRYLRCKELLFQGRLHPPRTPWQRPGGPKTCPV